MDRTHADWPGPGSASPSIPHSKLLQTWRHLKSGHVVIGHQPMTVVVCVCTANAIQCLKLGAESLII